jgi:hypothetical protein
VVFVDVQVAVATETQREAAVLADLFQHVVEERQAGVDHGLGDAIQVDLDLGSGFLGEALDPRGAAHRQQMRDAGPVPGVAIRICAVAAGSRGSRLRANCDVGGRSPTIAERASRCRDPAGSPSPGRGRLAGQAWFSCAKLAIDQHLAETDALASNTCIIRSCGPWKLSSG